MAALYAITIVGSAIGEWNYFILGSLIEATLLATIVYYAWTWPKTTNALDAGSDEHGGRDAVHPDTPVPGGDPISTSR